MGEEKTEKTIALAFRDYAGGQWDRCEVLPLSGSARQYYRVFYQGKSCIAVLHENIRENRLFIDFSKHFASLGLPVPAIYYLSGDHRVYFQEDLGDTTLLDVVERERGEGDLSPGLLTLYQKALAELLRMQLLGGEGLDYSGCLPRPVFDRTCVMWDLNYFKYCFSRLAAVEVDEQRLEADFEHLAAVITAVPADAFMFRDFQSRNVMVKGSDLYFIDYQGGRRGALQYDVASLLYDAIVAIPERQREELLAYYVTELGRYREVDAATFSREYYHFVLIRLLQAMGAFGLRGLHEGKPHFIDSIVPGITAILALMESGKLSEDYPEIKRTIQRAGLKFDRRKSKSEK